MLSFATQTKIKIARALSATLIRLRRLCAKQSTGIFRRGGLRWKLDLSEGIDLSIYLFGQFEREVARAYLDILEPGAIVLDIGANIGAHSLPMAKICGANGTVHAFEPTEYAVAKLRKNLALNPAILDQVKVHHALLNEGKGEPVPQSIPSSWQLLEENGGQKHPQHAGIYKTIGAAECMSLDHFVERTRISRIDLVKLDIDGNEWSVLQGAQTTIRRFAPPILMEFALDYEKEAFNDILGMLIEQGYSALDLRNGRPLSLDREKLRRIIPTNGSINVLLQQD